jgi:hypothetical protein
MYCGWKLTEHLGSDRSVLLLNRPSPRTGEQAPLETFAMGDGEATGKNVWEAALRRDDIATLEAETRRDDGNEDMSVSKAVIRENV